MKAIYLDCFSGISGNMLLGAFLQAGVPQKHLEEELEKLLPASEFKLNVSSVSRNGIQAPYVEVETPNGAEEKESTSRAMAEIRRLLTDSALSDAVKKKVMAIFTCLAEAEGKIHGRPVDEVHFHEVGAVDSIVDIVGTALALEYLEIDKVFTSRVNTGSGYVNCAHGRMMVPAPATAELLRGIPFYHNEEERELTTPTGAAVLQALAEYAENLPSEFQTEKIAYGAGTWELDTPNVLRVYVGEYQGQREERRYLLETNIDDMNPQDYGYVFERLLENGALDVWTTPILMKKNRPAVMLSVLVDEEYRECCADIVLQETTSIGLRVTPIERRYEAVRRTAMVTTPYGEVSCKISAYKGQIVALSAEYEDCRRLAKEHGVPLKKVRQAALSELERRLGD